MKKIMIKKAVIPAAGTGSRLAPLSDVMPKELFPLGKKAILDWIIEEAQDAGIKEILIIIAPNKSVIRNYLEKRNHKNIGIEFALQPEPLGLGDAISKARPWTPDEPFLLMLPDNLFSGSTRPASSLITAFKQVNANVIGLIKTTEMDVKTQASFSYPLLQKREMKNLYEITDFSNKPPKRDISSTIKPGNFLGVGRSLLMPSVFDYIERCRSELKPDQELEDTQPLKLAAEKGEVFGCALDVRRFDTGNWDGYLRALEFYISCCRRFEEK